MFLFDFLSMELVQRNMKEFVICAICIVPPFNFVRAK